MPKFPKPPSVARLAQIAPDLRVVPAGTELWRLYFRGSRHPATWNEFRAFGPVRTSRFDHHLPPPGAQERATLYAATAGPVCIAEGIQATRTTDRTARQPARA